jgi:hypothetical protein
VPSSSRPPAASSIKRREADLADIPLWSDLGESDAQSQILHVLSGDVAVGRPILTAPDVPAERIAALRLAFRRHRQGEGGDQAERRLAARSIARLRSHSAKLQVALLASH